MEAGSAAMTTGGVLRANATSAMDTLSATYGPAGCLAERVPGRSRPNPSPAIDSVCRTHRQASSRSRQTDASNASTPVTMVAMGSYFVAIFAVLNDPSGLVAVIATFVPFSAPMVVPMRAALGAITPIEIGVAAAITIATIWVLFIVGGRVYSGAALQTAGRMRLRDAWRSAGE